MTPLYETDRWSCSVLHVGSLGERAIILGVSQDPFLIQNTYHVLTDTSGRTWYGLPLLYWMDPKDLTNKIGEFDTEPVQACLRDKFYVTLVIKMLDERIQETLPRQQWQEAQLMVRLKLQEFLA